MKRRKEKKKGQQKPTMLACSVKYFHFRKCILTFHSCDMSPFCAASFLLESLIRNRIEKTWYAGS